MSFRESNTMRELSNDELNMVSGGVTTGLDLSGLLGGVTGLVGNLLSTVTGLLGGLLNTVTGLLGGLLGGL